MEITKVIVGLGSCGIAAGARKVYDKISALKEAENLNIELKKTTLWFFYLKWKKSIYHSFFMA